MKPTPAQIRWFRLRRSGLVKPFATPEETARRLVGVQAQMPSAAALAFRNRTRGCTAAGLEKARLEDRTLVRFWGQRHTVHLYATTDWPFLRTAIARPSIVHKRLVDAGLMGEFRRLVKRTGARLAKGTALTYKDVGSKKLAGVIDDRVLGYTVFMQLVQEGVACHGPDRGGRSSFVHRTHWTPDLDWSPPPAEEALPELARRYLAAYGPAEPRDLAFWCATTIAKARAWIEQAGAVQVGADLWCRAEDVDELAEKPGRWPVKLLHRFDPLLLATKDKSWLIDEQHYKKVWRAAAHVEAVVLVRGRIAGTWKYERSAKRLRVRVEPFEPFPRAVAAQVARRAAEVAAFWDLELDETEAETDR